MQNKKKNCKNTIFNHIKITKNMHMDSVGIFVMQYWSLVNDIFLCKYLHKIINHTTLILKLKKYISIIISTNFRFYFLQQTKTMIVINIVGQQ